jgi:hypothetical protein
MKYFIGICFILNSFSAFAAVVVTQAKACITTEIKGKVCKDVEIHDPQFVHQALASFRKKDVVFSIPTDDGFSSRWVSILDGISNVRKNCWTSRVTSAFRGLPEFYTEEESNGLKVYTYGDSWGLKYNGLNGEDYADYDQKLVITETLTGPKQFTVYSSETCHKQGRVYPYPNREPQLAEIWNITWQEN